MTVVVFHTQHMTIATESWAATELRDHNSKWVQVHCLEAPIKATCNLEMTMAEFLAMVTDAPKILDLRSIQRIEPARKSTHEIIRDVLSGKTE